MYFYHAGPVDLGKVVERGLGCIHLFEWGLARGDVGEDVGKTLGGHCERVVEVDVECKVMRDVVSIGETLV